MELSEVTAAVKKEISVIGAESKKNYEALQTDLSTLRTKFESNEGKVDSLLKGELKKFAEAASIRQDEMDKASQKRMDNFEVAYQRHGGQVGDPNKEFAEAREWWLAGMALRNQVGKRGLKDSDVNVQKYRDYKDVFGTYLRVDKEGMSEEERKFLLVGSDPDGGFRVPVAFSNRVTTRIFETSPIRELAAGETISTGAMEFGTDLEEITLGGWVGELDVPAQSGTPQIGRRRIEVHEQYAEPKITQTMLEDAAFDVEGWLARKVGEKLGRVENTAFVTGTGIAKPRGFLTYPAGTNVVKQIEQVNMGHASVLTTNGFTKVKYSMVESYLERGTWLMNRLTVRDTMLLKDGDGQYIWRAGLQPGQPSVILNLPLRMATDIPVVAANALAVALAWWQEAYLVVDRLGITTIRDILTAKPFVKYYTRKRVGGDVINFQAIKIGKIAA